MCEEFICQSKGKEEPFVRLVRLMELTGQLAGDGKYRRLLSTGAGFFCVNACVGPILYAFLADVPNSERSEAVLFASGAITICLKFFNNLLRHPRIKGTLDLLDELKDKYYEKEGEKVREEMWHEDRRSLRLIFVLLNALPPLMVLKALLVSKYPYPCWAYLDLREWYVTNFIWQTVTISIVMFSGGMSYSFNFLAVNQCVIHMKVLSLMLKMENINVEAIVKRHVLIVRLVRGINELFCWQIFLEYCFYTAQIALAGYNSIKLFRTGAGLGPVSVAIYVVNLYAGFAYFLCLCGHKITIESEILFRNVYESKWYDLPNTGQNTMRLMLCYSLRGLGLRYRNIADFSMERFSQLLNTTYSFLTLLFNMDM